MTDHPALVFEFPFIRHAKEAEILADVRKERKLPAADGTIISLAILYAFASQQKHIFLQIINIYLFRNQCGLAIFLFPEVPEVCAFFQGCPFALINGWNCVANIAAKWNSVWVIRSTFLPTIQVAERCMEGFVQFIKIQLGIIDHVANFS